MPILTALLLLLAQGGPSQIPDLTGTWISVTDRNATDIAAAASFPYALLRIRHDGQRVDIERSWTGAFIAETYVCDGRANRNGYSIVVERTTCSMKAASGELLIEGTIGRETEVTGRLRTRYWLDKEGLLNVERTREVSNGPRTATSRYRKVEAPDTAILRYAADAPLGIEPGLPRVFDGYSQTPMTFASPAGGNVPADLFESEPRAAAPAPAVIFVHGMPGSKDTMAPLAAAYARAGWIGLTLSAPFMRPVAYRKDFSRLLPLMFDEHDRQEMIQMFQDVTRAIDVLQAHPRVDRTRIALVGFSYGGGIGAWISALEPRVRAAALMAPTSGIATWIRLAPERHMVREYFQELPEAVRKTWLASMDTVEPWKFLATSEIRTPILIQAATRDGAVSAADTAHLTAAAGSRATIIWYDSGHILPPAAQIDQARYLARQLDADLDRFVPTRRRFASETLSRPTRSPSGNVESGLVSLHAQQGAPLSDGTARFRHRETTHDRAARHRGCDDAT